MSGKTKVTDLPSLPSPSKQSPSKKIKKSVKNDVSEIFFSDAVSTISTTQISPNRLEMISQQGKRSKKRLNKLKASNNNFEVSQSEDISDVFGDELSQLDSQTSCGFCPPSTAGTARSIATARSISSRVGADGSISGMETSRRALDKFIDDSVDGRMLTTRSQYITHDGVKELNLNNVKCIRDLLVDIKSKVDHGEQPPSYVKNIDEISTSWDGSMRHTVGRPIRQPFNLGDTVPRGCFEDHEKYHRTLDSASPVEISSRPGSPGFFTHDGYVHSFGEEDSVCSSLTGGGSFITHCTWRPLSRTQEDGSCVFPVIDVIPCLQPLELILAKADEKLRKTLNYHQMRDEKILDDKLKLEHAIELKRTRKERYQMYTAGIQRKKEWLKIATMLHYLECVKKNYQIVLDNDRRTQHQIRATYVILRFMRRINWVRKKKRMKKFAELKGNAMLLLNFSARLKRKKLAATKIVHFLSIYKEQKLVNMMIHEYFRKVHKCQSIARGIVECTRARMIVLTKFWDKLEYKYIRCMLTRQARSAKIAASTRKQQSIEKEKQRGLANLARFSKKEPMVSTRTNVTKKIMCALSRQGDIWDKIDGEIEGTLDRLRAHVEMGARKTMDERIEELLIDEHVKHVLLRNLLTLKRKEYLFHLAEELIVKPQEMRAAAVEEGIFSDEDAMLMLKGSEKDIRNVLTKDINLQDGERINQVKCFATFKYIKKAHVLGMIIEEHNKKNSFVVETDLDEMLRII